MRREEKEEGQNRMKERPESFYLLSDPGPSQAMLSRQTLQVDWSSTRQ
jgi:hypothetical protein